MSLKDQATSALTPDTATKSAAATIVNCPTCQTKVVWSTSNAHRPFCCERCKLIDLGEWASDGFKIAGKTGFGDINMPVDVEDIEAMLMQMEANGPD